MPVGSLFNDKEWEKLRLVRKLLSTEEGKGYWWDIKESGKHIADLLVWRPPGLEEFTDHDIKHCYRITANIGAILPQEEELNMHEIRILLFSILYHDLGMWTRSREVEKALDNEDFKRFCEVNFKQEYAETINLINSIDTSTRSVGRLYLRRLLSLWNRKIHGTRGGQEIGSTVKNYMVVPMRMSEKEAKVVSLIIEAHNWSSQQILEDTNLGREKIGNTGNPNEDFVNVRYLAIILRIGDLLDLDEGRISSLIWDYLSKLSPDSEKHWRMHKNLNFQTLEPDLIKIKGTFDYDRDGPIAAESFEIAKKWLKNLQEEIENLRKICSVPERYGQDSRVKMGALTLDIDGVVGKGIVFTKDLSFDLDKRRIMEILGKEIYADGFIFIRELLQNALDATRTQIVKDYLGENGVERKAWFEGEPLDVYYPSFWPYKYTSRNNYSIKVNTGIEYLDGKKYVTFEIIDKGIGMTVDQIKDYFLQIGKSYYQTKDFRNKYKHSTISRFGIGFLSCLLVAKKIEVISRPLSAPEGIRLLINADSYLCSAFREPNAQVGTRIKLWIKTDAVDLYEGWDKLLFDEYSLKALPELFSREENRKFETAIKQWCPWPEIKIIINGKEWGPRSPLDYSPMAGYLKVPFQINVDGRITARGCVVSKIEKGIPSTKNFLGKVTDVNILSSGGGITILPWDRAEDFFIIIDLAEIHPLALTAARRARYDIPSELSIKQIVVSWVQEIEKTLEENKPWLAIWRASLDWEDIDLPLLLPTKRGDKVVWEEWNESKFKTERYLMVPFFALFELELDSSLPIVGVPRRKKDSTRKIIPRIKDVCAVPLNGLLTSACIHPNIVPRDRMLMKGYTFLLHRVCYYDTMKRHWEPLDREDEAIKAENKRLFPSYDLDEDNIKWKKLCFDPTNENSWQKAYEIFGDPPHIEVPAEPINVDIATSDWELLSKRREMRALLMAIKMPTLMFKDD